MQKKAFLSLAIIGILLAISLFALLAPARPSDPPICRQSLDKKNIKCTEKKVTAPAGMLWENFSRQFISISSVGH
jgi:hypothetical protein